MANAALRCTAHRLIGEANRSSEADIKAGFVTLQTTIQHKYGDELAVSIKVALGGELVAGPMQLQPAAEPATPPATYWLLLLLLLLALPPLACAGSDDERILVVNMKCMSDSSPQMALDHRGRVLYANTGVHLQRQLQHALPVHSHQPCMRHKRAERLHLMQPMEAKLAMCRNSHVCTLPCILQAWPPCWATSSRGWWTWT